MMLRRCSPDWYAPPQHHFRKVENVVDDVEEVLAGLVCSRGEALLSSAESAAEQQFGHSENAVHGRADFVAHGRQELALGAAGAVGAIPFQRQFEGTCADQLLQLVAMRGELLPMVLDLLEHGVEPHRKPADLVARRDRRAKRVVALTRDLANDADQARYRSDDAAVGPGEHCQQGGGQQQGGCRRRRRQAPHFRLRGLRGAGAEALDVLAEGCRHADQATEGDHRPFVVGARIRNGEKGPDLTAKPFPLGGNGRLELCASFGVVGCSNQPRPALVEREHA